MIDRPYDLTLGDKMLALYRKLVSDAEKRSKQLPTFAYVMDLLGRGPPIELERTIRFKDGSRPLRLGTPIILAAGANKYAERINSFSALWYGGVMNGSGTRLERFGNDHHPRVGVIEEDRSLHNAMGLNNPGMPQITSKTAEAIKARDARRPLVVGVSVAETPGLETDEARIEDVRVSFKQAYENADMVELNVSCPNTGEKRIDQQYELLGGLFKTVQQVRRDVSRRISTYVKMSPGSPKREMERTIGMAQDAGFNGVVLYNTWSFDTLPEAFLRTPKDRIPVLTKDGKRGGVSSPSMYPYVKDGVKFVKNLFSGMSAIGCGGIETGYQVRELLDDCGADAVEILSLNVFRLNAARKLCLEYMLAKEEQENWEEMLAN